MAFSGDTPISVTEDSLDLLLSNVGATKVSHISSGSASFTVKRPFDSVNPTGAVYDGTYLIRLYPFAVALTRLETFEPADCEDGNRFLTALNEANKGSVITTLTFDIAKHHVEVTTLIPSLDFSIVQSFFMKSLDHTDNRYTEFEGLLRRPPLKYGNKLTHSEVKLLQSLLPIVGETEQVDFNSAALNKVCEHLGLAYAELHDAFDRARFSRKGGEERQASLRDLFGSETNVVTDEQAADIAHDLAFLNENIIKASDIIGRKFKLVDRGYIKSECASTLQSSFIEGQPADRRQEIVRGLIFRISLNERPSHVLFPLGGIDLVGRSVIAVGDGILFRMDEQVCAILSQPILDGLFPSDGFERRYFARHDQDIWIAVPFIGDAFVAEEQAARKAGLYLDFLRFFASASGHKDYFIDFIQNTAARARSGWGFYIGFGMTGPIEVPLVSPIILNELFDEKCAELGLAPILKVISNDERRYQSESLEGSFLRALSYFGSATLGVQPETRLLNYVGVLEAFLGFDKTRVKASLMENVAFILGYGYEDRKIYSELVSEIYDARSAIAHGRGKDELGAALSKAKDLATTILLRFSRSLETQTSRDEIQKRLELVRLGGPPFTF